jgi:hypothetical protein
VEVFIFGGLIVVIGDAESWRIAVLILFVSIMMEKF